MLTAFQQVEIGFALRPGVLLLRTVKPSQVVEAAGQFGMAERVARFGVQPFVHLQGATKQRLGFRVLALILVQRGQEFACVGLALTVPKADDIRSERSPARDERDHDRRLADGCDLFA